MSKCIRCQIELESSTCVILNTLHYCQHCLSETVKLYPDKLRLHKINILRDSDYVYVLPKGTLFNLISGKLTKKQYTKFKIDYPNSNYIQNKSYSDIGDKLEPKSVSKFDKILTNIKHL